MPKTKRARTRSKRSRGRSRPEWVHLTTEHLEKARNARGFSKKTWARQLGVSLAAYHAWLAGVNVPEPTKQQQIVRQLDAPTGLQALQLQALPREVRGDAEGAPRCASCPLHCGSAGADETAAALRTFALTLLERNDVPPAEIPALVNSLREALLA